MLWLSFVPVIIMIILIRDVRHSKQECRTVIYDCDCSEELFDWLEENQGVCVPCSRRGTALVLKRVQAYQQLLTSCSFLTVDREYLEYLEEILETHTCPRPPGRRKRPPRNIRPLPPDLIRGSGAFVN